MADIDDIWDDEEDRQQYEAPRQGSVMDANPMPCPFCGAPDPLVQDHEPHTHALSGFMPDYPGSTTVECLGCPVGIIKPTRAEAIAAWNRRQPPAVAVPEGWSANLLRRLQDERERALSEGANHHDKVVSGTAGGIARGLDMASSTIRLLSAAPPAPSSDLPPGLVLVATPYRDAPDKWMLIEMTGPGRAKVITGGCIETEAIGVEHAHSFRPGAEKARRDAAQEGGR